MSGHTKAQRVMNLIFKHFQSKNRVKIWLFDRKNYYIEGRILGFDEFMNLVLGDAIEYKKGQEETPKHLGGKMLLKGDNISLIQSANLAQENTQPAGILL